MDRPKVTFFTGVHTVTGANFLLEYKGKKFLIDCGFVQGSPEMEKNNWLDFSFSPSDIDVLFITHAHLDHVGRIAKLVKDGFRGVIYSTPETRKLAELIMRDALNIISTNAKERSLPSLYEKEHIDQALDLWQTIPYYENKDIEGLSVCLYDAGHILGSSMYQITMGDIRLLATGDLGHSPSPLLRDTDSVKGVTHIIMESVYGDRNHESRNERHEKFTSIAKSTLARGGTLLIPTFSLERTQVILFEINDLVEKNLIPSVPVFVDSPLATAITDIYKGSTHLFNKAAQERIANGDDLFDFAKLRFTVNRDDSERIHSIPGPKIVIAGSGMSMGGRIRRHEAELLPDAKNTLLLVGYQPPGTLGREIMSKPSHVNIDRKKVKLKAQVESIFGYSSHKDSDHLLAFVDDVKENLKQVFVVMGEPRSATFLAQRINDEIDGRLAICPEESSEYLL